MSRALTPFLFLASVFTATFEKLHWTAAGTVTLAHLFAIGFLVAFAAERLSWRDPRLGLVRDDALGVAHGGSSHDDARRRGAMRGARQGRREPR